jgi:hypothetical protein
MDTCIYCNPASTRGYDPEMMCENHIQHAVGVGSIYRSATVNRKIGEAFTAWRTGRDLDAAELLRWAARHSATPVRGDIARIATLWAADVTEPGGELGYLAVAKLCRR